MLGARAARHLSRSAQRLLRQHLIYRIAQRGDISGDKDQRRLPQPTIAKALRCGDLHGNILTTGPL